MILMQVRTGLVWTDVVCSGAVHLPRLLLHHKLETKMLFCPGQQVAGQTERSSRSRYELDLVRNLSALGTRPTLDLVHNLSAQGSSPEVLVSSLKQEGCKDGWIYSTEYYQSTVVSEVLNYCDSNYYCSPNTIILTVSINVPHSLPIYCILFSRL